MAFWYDLKLVTQLRRELIWKYFKGAAVPEGVAHRRKYSAIPGTGIVFQTIVSGKSGTSSYVPSLSMSCSPALWETSCNTFGKLISQNWLYKQLRFNFGRFGHLPHFGGNVDHSWNYSQLFRTHAGNKRFHRWFRFWITDGILHNLLVWSWCKRRYNFSFHPLSFRDTNSRYQIVI